MWKLALPVLALALALGVGCNESTRRPGKELAPSPQRPGGVAAPSPSTDTEVEATEKPEEVVSLGPTCNKPTTRCKGFAVTGPVDYEMNPCVVMACAAPTPEEERAQQEHATACKAAGGTVSTCQCGLLFCSVNPAPQAPADESPASDAGPQNELTCDERKDAARDLVGAALASPPTCNADSDCTTMSLATGCGYPRCDRVVHRSVVDKIQAARQQANERYCSTYRQDGCRMGPVVRCARATAVCVEGVCRSSNYRPRPPAK